MNIIYNVRFYVDSKTAKGQVFFRRLLNRQKNINIGFIATRKFSKVLWL